MHRVRGLLVLALLLVPGVAHSLSLDNAADLRAIYAALTAEAAESALEAFGCKWNRRFPTISKSWQASWQRVIPFFAHPPEIRLHEEEPDRPQSTHPRRLV